VTVGVVQHWDLSRLGTLGGALGDATRFAIYKHVVGSPDPVSASETAAVFGLHRTVARSHLEKLAEAGLLVIGTRRNPRGGRPAKIYAPSSARLDIQLPPRRYQTLSAMLARLAARLDGSSEALAEEVGYQYGCDVAAGLPGGQLSHDGALDLDAIAAHLRDAGCSPRIAVRDDRTVVVEVSNCVYLEVARDHPGVVCNLSSGMLCGLLGVDPEVHRHTASIIDGAPACVHEFAPPA
jgi:predicted ArsR family transcriptional regulator